MHYVYLGIAIILEVVGTSFLKIAYVKPGFWPITVIAISYTTSLAFMTLSLERFPIGLVYAIWAGMGIALVALSGVIFFGEKIDAAGLTGIGLIIAGVVVLNSFSEMSGH